MTRNVRDAIPVTRHGIGQPRFPDNPDLIGGTRVPVVANDMA